MKDSDYFEFLNTLDDICIVLTGEDIAFMNASAQRVWPTAARIVEVLPQDGLDFLAAHTELGTHRKICSEGSMWVTRYDDRTVLRMQAGAAVPLDLFTQVASNLREWLFVLDADFQIIWTNVAETHHMVGTRLHDVVPAELSAKVEEVHAAWRAGAEIPILEVEAPDQQGLPSWRRCTVVSVQLGDANTHAAVFVEDITDQRRADETLVRSEARYRTVLNNSLDIVALFGGDFRCEFVTPNVREFLGYDPEELYGVAFLDLLTEDDLRDLNTKMGLLISRPNVPITLETSLRHKDGTYRTVEARIRTTESGYPGAGYVCNVRDLTSRIELESLRQQLVRADKLAAVGQLAAGVAHEINNPLSFIYTNVFVVREHVEVVGAVYRAFQAALERGDFDYISRIPAEFPSISEMLDEVLEMVDVNLHGIERISHIVRELKTFSRDEQGDLEVVDVADVVEASLRLVRNQIEHIAHLEVNVPSHFGTLLTDRGKISQVLVNVLVNAAHAVSEAPHREHWVRLTCEDTGTEIHISVSDTGDGIAPENLEKIFEPFYTTKPASRGTGLGLWLCKDLVRMLGGRISVESTVGSGSRFTIALPRIHPNSQGPEPSLLPQEATGALRILAIDDDELVLKSMERLLSRDGHDVTLAKSGTEAIHLLNSGSDFDLILSDLMMPHLDGPSIHAYLRANRPQYLDRIIFCTAGVLTSQSREFIGRPDVRVLHKPVSATLLRGALRGHGATQKKWASESGRPA